MVLDYHLDKEEKIKLKHNFNQFTIKLEKLILDSGLFKKNKSISWFDSKREYSWRYKSENKISPFIRIHWSEYSKNIKFNRADNDRIKLESVYEEFNFNNENNGPNSFEISYQSISGVEEVFTGFFSSKKEYRYSPHSIYPMYLEDGKDKGQNNYGTYEYFLSQLKINRSKICINDAELALIKNIFSLIKNFVSEAKDQVIQEKNNFKSNKRQLILELDKDDNGDIDLVDGESYNKLLNKNQKCILEIDKSHIHKFVKVSIYLKTKKLNTQKIFQSIKDTNSDNELNELVNLLKNQIHTYELLVFHSISMVTSLVDGDLITFYEIYECFDQLGVFNSNWENEVSNKLTEIGSGIKDLMYSIYQMENKIVSSIDNLTYVTQDSFRDLSFSVEKQLSSIDSTIKFNNLLTGIQTYQMYKINLNTKRLN